jgi:lipopolysaccharide transport system permease protein
MKRETVVSGIRSLHGNRGLLWSLVVRELQGRYRGTVLGFMWVVVYPLTMLAVYSFVFGVVFRARWGGGQGPMSDFVQMLYSGLIVFFLFSETLSRAPGSVVSRPGYVKKVVFPLELLPVSEMLASLFSAAVGFALLFAFLLIKQQFIPWTVLLLPLIIIPLLLLTAGFAWLLAAIGVFFRDIGQLITVIMSILMFLSPIFYPVSALPQFAQKLMYLNPIAYTIEAVREVVVLGSVPNALQWLAHATFAVVVCWMGLWVFQRARPAFADVV